MTSNEIQTYNGGSLAEKKDFAEAMARSDMLPRAYQGKPANLLFAFEYADALGIPRINALTSIHVIDGKPTASADLIASLVRKAGHRMRVEGDDTYAEVTIIRADDPDYVPKPVRWDEAKARKAGKWGSKGPWTNYPGAMLRSRAITEAARMWASDALYGCIYTPEELGAETAQDGTPIVTTAKPAPTAKGDRFYREPENAPSSLAERLEPEPAQAVDEPNYDEIERHVADTTDLDELRRIWSEMQKVGTERAHGVQDIVMARKKDLETPEPTNDEPTPDEAQQTLAEVFEAEVVG